MSWASMVRIPLDGERNSGDHDIYAMSRCLSSVLCVLLFSVSARRKMCHLLVSEQNGTDQNQDHENEREA